MYSGTFKSAGLQDFLLPVDWRAGARGEVNPKQEARVEALQKLCGSIEMSVSQRLRLELASHGISTTGNPLHLPFICGPANRILGEMLRAEGVDLDFRSTRLVSQGYYPSPDHTIITVGSQDPVVIDAAYVQFLKVLGLEDSRLPTNSILVSSESGLDQIINGFISSAGERNTFQLKVVVPTVAPVSKYIQLSRGELIQYFQKIWSPEAGNHQILPE